jgi:hypothetical protein
VSAGVEDRTGAGVAWYVYGVVGAEAEAPDAAGVAGAVELLHESPIAAIVGRVGLEEFGDDAVKSRLEDPGWLAEKAGAHEAVLGAALHAGPVVPFRFLTVYGDESELRAFLSEHGRTLRALLDRLDGKVELGVKAFVDATGLEDAAAAESTAVVALDAEIAQAQSGRAYLLRRRRDEAVRDEARRLAGDLAAEIHASLLDAADDGVANPVQSRDVSGRPEEMVLNGAYLVDRDDRAFERALEAVRGRHGGRGVALERTGP